MTLPKALCRCCWALLALLVWSCNPAEPDQAQKPDKLLSPDEMVTILTEIHIAESQVNKMSLTATDSSALVYRRLEQQIYKKLNVDTAAYRKSYIYYAANPSKLEAIYKEIVKKLEQKLSSPKKPVRS